MVICMNREIHKIYDAILKLIILSYPDEFLSYLGVEKSIKQILHTEIITKKGRQLYLDFLCQLEDNTLLNIEFQFTGPYKNDLERFHDYNIHSECEYDSRCETLIISFRKEGSGQKTRKIGKTKSLHPEIIYLGNTDFKKILNSIENKAKINLKLTKEEEISLMIMCLLPKYKNKKIMLKRICKIHKKQNLFDLTKIDTFKAVIGLEIENFVNKEKREELKGELNMTPEAEKMIEQALSEVSKKHLQLEKEELIEKGRKDGIKEGRKDGIKEGRNEEKKEIAKKLKGKLTPTEISKITGLTVSTILKL